MIVDQNHYSIVDENHTYPSSEIHRLARQYQQLIPAHAKVIGVQIDNKADWIAIDIMCIKSNRDRTYTIVGSEEANIHEHKLSYLSPLGEALMGKEKGDKFEFSTPNGKQSYKVLKVE